VRNYLVHLLTVVAQHVLIAVLGVVNVLLDKPWYLVTHVLLVHVVHPFAVLQVARTILVLVNFSYLMLHVQD
jgi:hypothetical protein